MIFIGFGFLMTFLKKYGFSSVGLTMLIAAIIIQWGLLCRGFFRLEDGKISIDMERYLIGNNLEAYNKNKFLAWYLLMSSLQLC